MQRLKKFNYFYEVRAANNMIMISLIIILKPTVSPAVPLHWLMFVLGSASNISTTFHNLLDAAGGHDDDHGDGVVFEVVGDDFASFFRPGSPHW